MAISTLETIGESLSNTTAIETNVLTRLTGLDSRYGESWRHYHVLEHPLELFDILIANVDVVRDPKVVGWSMLYHDAVYDPTSTNGRNEELSARLCGSELPPLIGSYKAELVAKYIRATAQHEVDNSDPDLDFFLDADLAILGASPDRYDRYARDIRLEYDHVPAGEYMVGRIALLHSLAKRVDEVGLFRTELFKEVYEGRAQENIAREADQLKQNEEV